ncbi:hypothetical protein ADUPG1_011529, partial [Aduncisulcus paluster]
MLPCLFFVPDHVHPNHLYAGSPFLMFFFLLVFLVLSLSLALLLSLSSWLLSTDPVNCFLSFTSSLFPCSSSSSKILNEHRHPSSHITCSLKPLKLLKSLNQSNRDGHAHRLFLLFTRMLFFMVICSSICMVSAEVEISIPDANLRAAVCSALVSSIGLPANCPVITNIDMLSLTSLSASSVDTFEGLSYATDLASLTIDGTSTSDLEIGSTEIGHLPTSSLSTLYLQNIALSEDVSLSAFTMLTKLDLRNTGLTDSHSVLGSLSGVEEQLVELTLRDNIISDISALSGMVNLTYLHLYNNQISDVSPLENLVELTCLHLGSNQITSIDSLSNMDDLVYLYLYYNNISNISALSGMINLTTLYLYSNSISDVSPLVNITNLTDLRLQSNAISDISALSGMSKLSILYLGTNNISDISVLFGKLELLTLDLNSNTLSDISFLSGMSKLANLYLHNNNISDISALSSMNDMNILYLRDNNISDISALSGMLK